MAFAPGRNAYVTVDGYTKKFDSWGFASNTDAVDISDYSRRSAKYAKGLPSGNINLSGPYEVGELAMTQGGEYPVRLGITSSIYIASTIIITSIKLATSVRGVARVDVMGVINADLEAEVTIHEDL